jgi:hypothetical protein
VLFQDACKIAVICDATHAANSKIGCDMYFERMHFFCPNKLYLYAVFLSGSETGCKGNGDVLHATSLHLEFLTC